MENVNAKVNEIEKSKDLEINKSEVITEEKPLSVPYIVYEGEQARSERYIKRLIIAIIIIIAMLFLSNIIWLFSWIQYDYVSEEVTVDSQSTGDANYIGNDGDIYNGQSNSEETNTSQE